MAMIQFVRNYDDLSTDRGFQFKFHCDKCGNGFLSRFQPSLVGTAGSILRAAGDIFGGWAGSVGNSTYEIQRAVGGPAHDSALITAVTEGKQNFKQCSRCGKWVCPEICWNHGAGQCEECAPDFKEELASSQAHAKADAARNQLYEKAAAVNYTGEVDMAANSVLKAPSGAATAGGAVAFCGECGAKTQGAKFCPECGTAIKVAARKVCAGCGCSPENPVKFCPDCGQKM